MTKTPNSSSSSSSKSSKRSPKELFLELEMESRSICGKLTNLVERRGAVHRNRNSLLQNDPSLFSLEDFDAWVIQNGEALMVQLFEVCSDMAVLLRKLHTDGNTTLVFALNLEYHRKLQLLETLRSIGEFHLGKDVEYFQSLQASWRCDSAFGHVQDV